MRIAGYALRVAGCGQKGQRAWCIEKNSEVQYLASVIRHLTSVISHLTPENWNWKPAIRKKWKCL